MEWKPIETAPKDGTEFLATVADPHVPGRRYFGVAQWAEKTDMPRSVAGWFWPYAIRPTMWTPIIPPSDETPL